MERFCVNFVMSNWLTITLLELCVIIFNTGMYALAWRLAKAKCQSCHTLQPAAAVRDPIRAVYSSKPGVTKLGPGGLVSLQSSNPNQTHLKLLIKVLLDTLETSRQVC